MHLITIIEAKQIVNDSFFVPVNKDFYNRVVVDIGYDATRFDEMNFVNTHPFWGFEMDCAFQFADIVSKDGGHSKFRAANIVSKALEGSLSGLPNQSIKRLVIARF